MWYSVLEYWDIPFWNFLFWDLGCWYSMFLLELFIHVQDVNDITASYGRFGLFAIGFVWCLVFVVIEIGSLARFTCFSNFDLSCIFWSISNPFIQTTVSSLLMCFSSSLWNIFPITPITFEVIQLSEWVKHQKCKFCIHFTFTNHMMGRIGIF